MLKKLDVSNFNNEINANTTLVDFYADWCGPCKMIAPLIEEIASERDDITVGKVNVDSDAEIAIKYGVSSIPTLIVFKNGKEATRVVGYRAKEDILAMLKKKNKLSNLDSLFFLIGIFFVFIFKSL